jgi:predicted transcriptional regulator YheO
MFGVKESRQPIKGEFAKKLIEEVQRMIKLKKEGKDLHFENKERERKYNIIIVDKEEDKENNNMTQEKKQEILQKLEDKGLCSIDANLILDKAIQYSSVKGEYVIERYAIELADLLLSTTVFDKK